ncbi:MAG: hypothetical protein M1826_002998 [Phylliscum demangeonii]|nr:MAG: hypothetical protein M1826_002998 [Phylliscum demangeonii]
MSTLANLYRRTTFSPVRLPLATRPFSSSPSSQLARMTLIGRLGAAPEIQTSTDGKEQVRYTLGVNYGRGEKRHTSWFRIRSFSEGSQKDFLMKIPRGSQVCVEGDVQIRMLGADGGVLRPALFITQRTIELLRRPLVQDADHQAPKTALEEEVGEAPGVTDADENEHGVQRI